jgi:hypothetical protein
MPTRDRCRDVLDRPRPLGDTKAVHWALRQIGKRSRHLNRLAIRTARQIKQLHSRAARWIAADALRELTSDKVRARLARRDP